MKNDQNEPSSRKLMFERITAIGFSATITTLICGIIERDPRCLISLPAFIILFFVCLHGWRKS